MVFWQIYTQNDEQMDLNEIKGKEPSKYGRNLARKLFSSEELRNGMVSPGKSGLRGKLSPQRCDLIKSMFYVKSIN